MIIEAAILDDQEHGLLVAVVRMAVDADRRRDRGAPGRPVLALPIDSGEAIVAPDDQRHGDGIVPVRALGDARRQVVHGDRQRG